MRASTRARIASRWPRHRGQGDSGRPFSVAASAWHFQGDERHIAGDDDVTFTANGGILNLGARSRPLNGGGSKGFRSRGDGDTIAFTGKACMTIYPKQMTGRGG